MTPSPGEQVKRWYTRDPDKLLPTAQIRVVPEAAYDALRAELAAAKAKYASAVNTLKEIADMGRKAGSESARHRLTELGEDVPDYRSMT